MTLTFEIILLVMMVIAFIGAIGERDNKQLRLQMLSLCVSSTFAYLLSRIFL